LFINFRFVHSKTRLLLTASSSNVGQLTIEEEEEDNVEKEVGDETDETEEENDVLPGISPAD
jgi:hypothetical protein